MQMPFFGKVALIDLTDKTVTIDSIDMDLYPKLLGGKGLGAYLLLSYLPSGTDPLSPDNIIILTTGPLTGSIFPGGSRITIVTQSPLTGAWLDSNAGGFLGREMKRTGWDALIIRGRSEHLNYLFIRNDKIEFREASHLKGFSTSMTAEHIKGELKDDLVEVVSIGKAGENGVLYACASTGQGMFGRGGIGAVMGSKNLKAVAIRGTSLLPWNDQSEFRELVKGVRQKIRGNAMIGRGGKLPNLGTHFTVELTNQFGVLPTRNWQESYFPDIEQIWPSDFSTLKTRSLSCYQCPVGCKRLSSHGEQGQTLGPEYEAMYSLGSNCGVHNAETVIAANHLCTEYGLDCISTGVTLSFVMECYEKGLITTSDLDGISMTFGNEAAMYEMIHRIANLEGIGKLLSQGVTRVSKQIGGESSAFAMTVKDLELPGYDPRGMKTMALLYATSDRGGCHMRGLTLRDELLGIPKKFDRLSYKNKAFLAAELQKEYALMNSFSTCIFDRFVLKLEDYSSALNCLFSCNWTVGKLEEVGQRIWNLTRFFNCQEGFSRKDDTLPNRLFSDHIPEGPSKGETVDQRNFNQMLDDYYAIQGWNNEGVPKEDWRSYL